MDDFERQIEAQIKDAEQKLLMAQREIVLLVYERIVIRSPVDTGLFKGNWQINIGSTPTGVVSIKDKTGRIVISQASAALLNYKLDDPVFIVNNLPYANRLEQGWSKQAPYGMVSLTLNEFSELVRQVGLRISRL